MESRLRNILRTTNVTEFIKAILESFCKVLLGPYILVVPKRLFFFFNGRWTLSDFWYLDCYGFCYIFRKIEKLYFLEASHGYLKTRQKSYPSGPTLKEKRSFKNLKILSSLAPFISKTKRADILNFLSGKYFNKRLSFLKIWHTWVNRSMWGF